MTEPNKPKSPNWFANITPEILGRVGTPGPGHVETHGPGGGFSVATEQHPGDAPPDAAITVISRMR
jgi:hypothetical protein